MSGVAILVSFTCCLIALLQNLIMDMCFGKVLISLKYLVDISSCVFGDDSNPDTHIGGPSPSNACSHEIDILGKDEDIMQEFIQNSLCNLENNVSFYPSM